MVLDVRAGRAKILEAAAKPTKLLRRRLLQSTRLSGAMIFENGRSLRQAVGRTLAVTAITGVAFADISGLPAGSPKPRSSCNFQHQSLIGSQSKGRASSLKATTGLLKTSLKAPARASGDVKRGSHGWSSAVAHKIWHVTGVTKKAECKLRVTLRLRVWQRGLGLAAGMSCGLGT